MVFTKKLKTCEPPHPSSLNFVYPPVNGSDVNCPSAYLKNSEALSCRSIVKRPRKVVLPAHVEQNNNVRRALFGRPDAESTSNWLNEVAKTYINDKSEQYNFDFRNGHPMISKPSTSAVDAEYEWEEAEDTPEFYRSYAYKCNGWHKHVVEKAGKAEPTAQQPIIEPPSASVVLESKRMNSRSPRKATGHVMHPPVNGTVNRPRKNNHHSSPRKLLGGSPRKAVTFNTASVSVESYPTTNILSRSPTKYQLRKKSVPIVHKTPGKKQ